MTTGETQVALRKRKPKGDQNKDNKTYYLKTFQRIVVVPINSIDQD